ncbi:hypothetical protein L218DRAFT_940101 [Marasmius fiardii PR-910]|nr:hypothetical protein L218DRAFT_940101 [Marasmius fiardii PR-910]
MDHWSGPYEYEWIRRGLVEGDCLPSLLKGLARVQGGGDRLCNDSNLKGDRLQVQKFIKTWKSKMEKPPTSEIPPGYTFSMILARNRRLTSRDSCQVEWDNETMIISTASLLDGSDNMSLRLFRNVIEGRYIRTKHLMCMANPLFGGEGWAKHYCSRLTERDELRVGNFGTNLRNSLQRPLVIRMKEILGLCVLLKPKEPFSGTEDGDNDFAGEESQLEGFDGRYEEKRKTVLPVVAPCIVEARPISKTWDRENNGPVMAQSVFAIASRKSEQIPKSFNHPSQKPPENFLKRSTLPREGARGGGSSEFRRIAVCTSALSVETVIILLGYSWGEEAWEAATTFTGGLTP